MARILLIRIGIVSSALWQRYGVRQIHALTQHVPHHADVTGVQQAATSRCCQTSQLVLNTARLCAHLTLHLSRWEQPEHIKLLPDNNKLLSYQTLVYAHLTLHPRRREQPERCSLWCSHTAGTLRCCRCKTASEWTRLPADTLWCWAGKCPQDSQDFDRSTLHAHRSSLQIACTLLHLHASCTCRLRRRM
jgi:hypothetical protein